MTCCTFVYSVINLIWNKQYVLFIDAKKNLSVLWEKKKSKCLKKNFQSVERGKNVSVEFRVFEKEIERKVREKKIKVFLGENQSKKILLSLYSLVGLYV